MKSRFLSAKRLTSGAIACRSALASYAIDPVTFFSDIHFANTALATGGFFAAWTECQDSLNRAEVCTAEVASRQRLRR